MPWGRWKTLAALLLACAGCTDLPTLDKGVCGNGVIDAGEQCDGGDLGGYGCWDFGYDQGYLQCSGCGFDTSQCWFSCPFCFQQ